MIGFDPAPFLFRTCSIPEQWDVQNSLSLLASHVYILARTRLWALNQGEGLQHLRRSTVQ